MAGLTTSDVIAKVRTRLQLTTDDMSDADITSLIADAQQEYSQNATFDVYGTFNIIANQQDYDFETIAPSGNLQAITEVLYSTGTMYGGPSFDPELNLYLDAELLRSEFGGNIYDNPSLAMIFFTKLEAFRDRFEVEWDVLTTATGSVLRLLRVPTEAGTAYFRGSGIWTLAQIEGSAQIDFLNQVFALVCEARANKLAIMKSYSEGGPGVSFSPAFEFWAKQADDYRKKVAANTGGMGGTLLRG